MPTNDELKALTASQITAQTEANSVTRTNIKGRIDAAYDYTDQEVETRVEKVEGKQLSTEDYSTEDKDKLAGVEVGATANDTDDNLKDRENHTGVQAIDTVTGLQTALDARLLTNMPNSTIQRIETASTTTGSGASRRLIFGPIGQDLVDNGGIQKGAPLSILSSWNNNNTVPAFISTGIWDATKPNGMLIAARTTNGSPSVQGRMALYFKSSVGWASGTAAAADLGAELEAIIAEPSSGAAGTGFSFSARLNAGTANFFDRGNLANLRSVIATFIGQNVTTFFDPAFFIRIFGDVHIGGAIYVTAKSSGLTLNLTEYVYLYKGAGGETLTLPDPADADNSAARTIGATCRTHKIVNMGDGVLNLSRNVYRTKTDFITSIPNTYPGNSIEIMIEGGFIWQI
jgi:hypothetical protein